MRMKKKIMMKPAMILRMMLLMQKRMKTSIDRNDSQTRIPGPSPFAHICHVVVAFYTVFNTYIAFIHYSKLIKFAFGYSTVFEMFFWGLPCVFGVLLGLTMDLNEEFR